MLKRGYKCWVKISQAPWWGTFASSFLEPTKRPRVNLIWTYDFASLILSPCWRSRTIPRVLWLTANTFRQSVRLWSGIDPRTICLHQRKVAGLGETKRSHCDISDLEEWSSIAGSVYLLSSIKIPWTPSRIILCWLSTDPFRLWRQCL